MIKIFYESNNNDKEKINVEIKMQGYIDNEEIDDIIENDTASKLVEEFISDIPDALNEIIIRELKEELSANGSEAVSELIQAIDFPSQGCGELKENNIIELTGDFLCDGETSNFDLMKMEKYLGGKQGIIALELPNDVYQASVDGKLVEVLIDPGYDIKVTINN